MSGRCVYLNGSQCKCCQECMYGGLSLVRVFILGMYYFQVCIPRQFAINIHILMKASTRETKMTERTAPESLLRLRDDVCNVAFLELVCSIAGHLSLCALVTKKQYISVVTGAQHSAPHHSRSAPCLAAKEGRQGTRRIGDLLKGFLDQGKMSRQENWTLAVFPERLLLA